MTKGKRLKELMQEKQYLVTPGITTLHAIVVEKAGFDFVYTGAYDASLKYGGAVGL
jgi:2-methylisocitrate lyase-like PEP mutase family enzyme